MRSRILQSQTSNMEEEPNEAGHMSYEVLNLAKNEDNTYTVTLEFVFEECMSLPEGTDKIYLAEQWCARFTPYGATEYFEGLSDIIEEEWIEPRVLQFKMKPHDNMSYSEIKQELRPENLYDGPYECLDAEEYFWCVPKSFLTGVM